MSENTDKTITILYKNWRGETAQRRITPIQLWFGRTEYHPEEQWLLKAYDLNKKEERDFALTDIIKWE